MKPTFTDLTPEEQANFGDGCTWVPDFIFTASCQHHDFNYYRGGGIKDKLKADWDMARLMWHDSTKFWHFLVTIIYWVGLTILPIPYIMFDWGRYKTLEEIKSKESKMNNKNSDIYSIAVDAVEEVLFKDMDKSGNTRFAREVHDAVFNSSSGGESRFQRELADFFYGRLGKWLLGGGIVVITSGGILAYQVQQHNKVIGEQAIYTRADAVEDNRLQEGRDLRQDQDVQQLRQEVNSKLDIIIERL